MYSRTQWRTAGGSFGAANTRLMILAERPDDLWLALRMVHVVLRGSPSTRAFSSSVVYPSAERVSPNSLILANCRAFRSVTRFESLGHGPSCCEGVADADNLSEPSVIDVLLNSGPRSLLI